MGDYVCKFNFCIFWPWVCNAFPTATKHFSIYATCHYDKLKRRADANQAASVKRDNVIYRVLIKYCVFFQEFSKVCLLSLASTRLLLVVQKLPANSSDCTLTLRWELWRSLTAMEAREGLQWIVKKHNFSWTPCIKWTRVKQKAQGIILKDGHGRFL